MGRPSILTLCVSCGLAAACASAPFPGDERITDGPSFDARSPAPTEPKENAKATDDQSGAKSGERKTAASLAKTYQAPSPAGPAASVILGRHYEKCRPSAMPANLMLSGKVVIESPDRKLLGPYELTVEPSGRFVERMTLAASADAHDYGEGVERERGFDGTTGWRKDGRVGGYFVDEIERDLFTVDAHWFMGRWAEVLKDLKTVGETELGGFPVHRVQGRSKTEEVFELYFHRDTSFFMGRAQLDPENPNEPLSKVIFYEVTLHGGFCVPARVEILAGEEKQTVTLANPRPGIARKAIALPPELRDLGNLEGE